MLCKIYLKIGDELTLKCYDRMRERLQEMARGEGLNRSMLDVFLEECLTSVGVRITMVYNAIEGDAGQTFKASEIYDINELGIKFRYTKFNGEDSTYKDFVLWPAILRFSFEGERHLKEEDFAGMMEREQGSEEMDYE